MKLSKTERAANAVIGFFLLLFAFLCIYPLYFVAINSFSLSPRPDA